MPFQLRDYQVEDCHAVFEAFGNGSNAVIGRAATGLGKALEIAELARVMATVGRVMILVDVGKLVTQLADTILAHTGVKPGIEMGEEWARVSGGLTEDMHDRIIVGTVQSQYSGKEGAERYRRHDPKEYSALMLDECETFLAPKAREVVDWYRQNPKLKVYGCSATPFRTDGTAMANLFDAKAFDRDIAWGIENGWLVKPKQAFVRVSLDFSSLKVRKDVEGAKDYSDEELSAMMQEEQFLVECAKGMHAAVKDRKSIVVCPTVAVAKAISHYLCAEKQGCAEVIYGELPDETKDRLFDYHAKGKFQFLCSVMMLTKGYDDKTIRAVVNMRKTKSKRLYQQIVGRGVRPLSGVVDGPPTPEDRTMSILESGKPDVLIVDLAGVDQSVKDINLIDILGEKQTENVRERAKRKQLAGEEDVDKAIGESEKDIAKEEEDKEKAKRTAAEIQAIIEVDYEEDMQVNGQVQQPRRGGPTPQQASFLRKFKVPDRDIAAMSAGEAGVWIGDIKRRLNGNLCSYRQAKILQQRGFTKAQTYNMPKGEATKHIDQIAIKEGWKKTG